MILKFFDITIMPLSGFGTPLKGDTVFGHFCWQARHDPSLLEGGLEKQIKLYNEKPFAVFSSAFPKIKINSKEYYALKRPEIPWNILFPSKENRLQRLKKAKADKKKKWMLAEKNSIIDPVRTEFITESQICGNTENQKEDKNFILKMSQQHNTINRLTNTTGENLFAPYLKENSYYIPGTLLSVFVLIDGDATDINRILKGLDKTGKYGFGRDASTGMGKFKIIDYEELIINRDNHAFYSLAPCVPDMNNLEKIYSSVFTRFGKHGDYLACSKHPFKNPVIMADEASVFIIKGNKLNKPYIGTAVSGISKILPETVVQGYTPCLPIKLEQNI